MAIHIWYEKCAGRRRCVVIVSFGSTAVRAARRNGRVARCVLIAPRASDVAACGILSLFLIAGGQADCLSRRGRGRGSTRSLSQVARTHSDRNDEMKCGVHLIPIKPVFFRLISFEKLPAQLSSNSYPKFTLQL